MNKFLISGLMIGSLALAGCATPPEEQLEQPDMAMDAAGAAQTSADSAMEKATAAQSRADAAYNKAEEAMAAALAAQRAAEQASERASRMMEKASMK
jgi:hypothetical protein